MEAEGRHHDELYQVIPPPDVHGLVGEDMAHQLALPEVQGGGEEDDRPENPHHHRALDGVAGADAGLHLAVHQGLADDSVLLDGVDALEAAAPPEVPPAENQGQRRHPHQADTAKAHPQLPQEGRRAPQGDGKLLRHGQILGHQLDRGFAGDGLLLGDKPHLHFLHRGDGGGGKEDIV